jgi:hypothetical protein
MLRTVSAYRAVERLQCVALLAGAVGFGGGRIRPPRVGMRWACLARRCGPRLPRKPTRRAGSARCAVAQVVIERARQARLAADDRSGGGGGRGVLPSAPWLTLARRGGPLVVVDAAPGAQLAAAVGRTCGMPRVPGRSHRRASRPHAHAPTQSVIIHELVLARGWWRPPPPPLCLRAQRCTSGATRRSASSAY